MGLIGAFGAVCAALGIGRTTGDGICWDRGGIWTVMGMVMGDLGGVISFIKELLFLKEPRGMRLLDRVGLPGRCLTTPTGLGVGSI